MDQIPDQTVDQYDVDSTPIGEAALEDEFWGHEPTRRFERPVREQRRARPRATMAPVAPGPRPPVDPLLRRTGLLAVVIGLLVPAALALRTGATEAASDTATIAFGSAPTTVAPAANGATGQVDYPMVGRLNSTDLPLITPPGDSTSSPITSGIAQSARTQGATASVACGSHYDVRSGDSWSLIASRANVDLDRLLAANAATASSVILVGQQICLSAGASVSALTAAAAATSTATKTSVSAPPTTLAPPPSRSYSRDQVIQIIREEWPDDLEDTAIMIAERESHLTPTAQNWCCLGLFQIYWNVHKGWLAVIGITDRNQMFDPRNAARAGYALYRRSNSFGPWGL